MTSPGITEQDLTIANDKPGPLHNSYQIWLLETDQLIYEKSIDKLQEALVVPLLAYEAGIKKERLNSKRVLLLPTFITPALCEVILGDTFLMIFICHKTGKAQFISHVQRLGFQWTFGEGCSESRGGLCNGYFV